MLFESVRHVLDVLREMAELNAAAEVRTADCSMPLAEFALLFPFCYLVLGRRGSALAGLYLFLFCF